MVDKVFRNNKVTKKIEFVGNFEGLYREVDDPWDQSAPKNSSYKQYYTLSRRRLLNALLTLNCSSSKLLEIGCGLGYVLECINLKHPDLQLVGIDISQTAIAKAKAKYSNFDFYVSDIRVSKKKLQNQYDIVILSQMLWYILDDLTDVFKNISKYLHDDGILIITQAFFKEQQKYGRDIIDGYEGLITYCKNDLKSEYEVVTSSLYEAPDIMHDDCLILLRKI
jgi:SAM-dependent methyltransferase